MIKNLKNNYQNNKDFVIDTILKKKISYYDFFQYSNFLNIKIKNRIKTKSKISIFLENDSRTLIAYLSLILGGYEVVIIDPNLDESKINQLLKYADCNYVIVSPNNKIKIDKKIKQICLYFNFFTKKNKVNINKYFLSINLNDLKKYLKIEFTNKILESKVIFFTSGTTGFPKMITHKVSNLFKNTRAFIKIHKFNSDLRFINFLPLYFLGGYYNLFLIPLFSGSSIVLTKPFNAKLSIVFWDEVIKHNINTLWFTPLIVRILNKINVSTDKITKISNKIKYAFMGMDASDEKLKKNFYNKFKIKILENYGLSETLFISTETNDDKKSYGAGKILPNIKVIFDGKSKSKKNGKIFVKSPYFAENIIKNSKLYFDTGDTAKLDSLNNLSIIGRTKDLIIKGGINISPKSIEIIYDQFKYFSGSTIVGLTQKNKDDLIILFFKLNKNIISNEYEKMILNFTESKLEKKLKPDYFIELNSIPLTKSGKVKKNDLRKFLIKKLDTFKPNINFYKFTLNNKNNLKLKSLNNISTNIIKVNHASSIKINDAVYEKKENGLDVIVLSLGEAYFDIPLFNFKSLPTQKIYHYTNSRGIPELRKKISEYFYNNYNFYFNPYSEILITAGSKIAIMLALMAILNDNEEVIIIEPAWVSYIEQVKIAGGKPVSLNYNTKINQIEKYINKRTKAIILNNPQNPSGKTYSKSELTNLNNIAKKHNIFIISDEVYSDFVDNQKEKFVSMGEIDESKSNLIICNSISKNYGISGWRLGYLISNENIVDQILKLNQHILTCAPSVLQYYVAKYFDKILNVTKPQIIDVLNKRKLVLRFLDKIQIKYLSGNSTFYIFISIKPSKIDSNKMTELLLNNYNISCVAGIGYGVSCDKFLRISIGTESLNRIKKALTIVKNLIDKTS